MLHVRSIAYAAMNGAPPMFGPLRMEVAVSYEYPASWSKKRREATRWKDTRPDIDNLAKVVMDAIGNSPSLASRDHLPLAIVYVDDAQICELIVVKRYEAAGYVGVFAETLT
jgi:Holliday junction resolvase RusA-like endonuclease